MPPQRDGSYKPQPVRRVEIPKATGGEPDYSWFNREEYELQRHLDFADWAVLLEMRLSLRKEYQTQLASNLDHRARKQFWDDYCKSVSIKKYLEKKQEEISALPWRGPPLVEVTGAMLSPERRDRVITWMIAMAGYRVLLINPWSNYESLKKEFDRWLRKLGQEFRPPFRRRGPPGANIEVTKLHLKSWVNHGILAVFDLDFCSEVFATRPLSRSALHKRIDPKSPNAAEWAKRARHLVQQAVDGLEYLTVQARNGGK
jgi:hypothetical protein